MDGLGADHILWGTDTPVIGPPHWQIQGFQTFTIPDEMIEKNKYQQLTPEVKQKIFGENVARLFNIDIKKARQGVENDLLYKLRNDGAALPVTVDAGSRASNSCRCGTQHFVSGRQVHDARIAAAMNIQGITHLLTFNKDDFKRFTGIVAVSPSKLVLPLEPANK